MSIESKVLDFYIAQWGEPSRRAKFVIDQFQIEIYKWSESENKVGVTLYATLGASAHPLRGYDTNHRLEFVLGLTPEQDEIASPLAALGLYSIRENATIGHGHTVPAGKPLWSGTQMCTFLLIKPRLSFLAPLELESGLHVEFLQVVPIYEAERLFNADRGIQDLIKRWEQKEVPFWRADRHSEPAG